MKHLLSLILVFTTGPLSALETPSVSYSVSFIGPCSETPLLSASGIDYPGQSAGGATLKTLQEHSIPFLGNELAMNSIFNTPVGLEAIEVISDTEMLAHGWCFSVNGQFQELFPGQVELEDGDEILWWFGFASFKDGIWMSQCEPSYARRPAQFCAFN